MASEQSDRAQRAGSFSSSSADTATNPENEKLARLDQGEDGLEKQGDLEVGEDEGLLPQDLEKPEPRKSTFKSSFIWMVVNTLATIGIVCAQRHLFAPSGLLTMV
jgi:solute carrier family 35 protein E3